MPTAETTFGILGIKTGFFAAFAAVVISLLAAAVGFAFVPLAPGKEVVDAARRLAAGLLSSFTFGLFAALKCLTTWPETFLHPWQKVLAGEHDVVIYLAASAPFLALAALPGFWIVAMVMRYFTRRDAAGQDIGQLAADVRNDVSAIANPLK
jgi:hypothetical protein